MQRLFIKKPSFKDPNVQIGSKKGQRKTFSIYKRVFNENGTTNNETIKSKEIDSINDQYLQGAINYDLALRNIKKVFTDLQKEAGIFKSPDIFNNQNQKILENYWKSEYEDRDLVDPKSAKAKLQRAIDALGNVSLLTASKKEIETQIESKKFPNNKQREVVSKLNLLLRFIKREIKLNKKRKERQKVKYLNEFEVKKIAKLMGDEVLENMVLLAFYSGARQGELYPMSEELYNGKTLLIESQIDKEDVERDPKWGSKRKAYLIPEGKKSFTYWINNKDQVVLTRTAISKRFKTACKKTFSDKAKWCKFHDLRHSYAIYLLSKGVGLTLVAQSLGNSLAVAQEYYAGFTLVDETIDTIDRIVRQK
jgi:integrase